MEKNTVTFIDNKSGKKHTFPIKKGSSGPDVVDLTTFFQKLGCLYMILDLPLLRVVRHKLHILMEKKELFFIEVIKLRI